jgi:phosphate transport system substrate-binding protein
MDTIKTIFIYAIISISLLVGCGSDVKDVTMKGSTTMGPLMKKIAESYKKSSGGTIQVGVIGSLKGLSLLLAGKNDIADSSVKIPAEQLLETQKKGIAIKEILIGYDIIIPIIHRSNSVGNLFLGQFADIYTGLIRDWKDVGGKSGKIIVVDRINDSGTKLVMSEKFFESKTVAGESVIMNCDSNVVAFVAQHPEAVGYISKSFINPSVKVLNINGFNATLENVEKNYYPLCRELYLYINEKSYSGQIKSFIDFVLSKNGQEILQHNGFIPISSMKKN